jgi:hypothetical protein
MAFRALIVLHGSVAANASMLARYSRIRSEGFDITASGTDPGDLDGLRFRIVNNVDRTRMNDPFHGGEVLSRAFLDYVSAFAAHVAVPRLCHE